MSTGAAVEPLRAEGISKRFGGVLALSEVTCVAGEGRVTGLVGPNGSGKSTLLNIAGGHMRADSGRVLVDGRATGGASPNAMVRSGVVRLFQHPRVAIELSPLDNIAAGAWSAHGRRVPFSGRALRLMRDAARAAAGEVAIAGLLGRPMAQLTHVELRLVEFARAIASQPRILLLDEPMAGLDGDERARVSELIRRLAASGTTILLVEHDLAVIRELADRCYCLVNGVLRAAGETAAVLADPVVLESYVGVAAGV